MLIRNLPLKIAALALAVFLWFWVLLKEQNLISEQAVKATIVSEGVRAGLALSGQLPEAQVRLRGLRQDVNEAAGGVEVYVSCAGLGAGRHQRAVEVRVPADVSVVAVRPAEVTVVLEEVISEARQVEVRLVGEPPAGYKFVGVEASPKAVEVSGAQSSVERATHAVVTMDLGRAMPEAPLSLPVQVGNSSGEAVQGVAVTPARVNVLATLELVVSSRTVPVVVQTGGYLPEELRLVSVQVEPAMVTIVGPANRVNEVEQIETQELALTGITSSFSRTLSLAVPQGVNLYSEPSVQVTVKVEKVQPASGTQEEPLGESSD